MMNAFELSKLAGTTNVCQVGAEVAKLKPLWPAWDFTDVPTGSWWHTHNPQDLKTVSEQSDGAIPTNLTRHAKGN